MADDHQAGRGEAVGRRLRAAADATVFLSSACIMVVEIVAGRLISRYLGQSLYTWTSVIGVVLAGIALGNYLGGRLADRGAPRRVLAALFGLSALACVLVPLANRGAGEWLFLLERSWPARVFLHVLAAFLLPSALLGAISPVAAKMALDGGGPAGRTLGGVYAWGAAGSILGTFAAGFFLVAVLGTNAVLAVVAVVLAVLGAAYTGWSWLGRGAVLLAAAAAWLALAATPRTVALARALGYREPVPPGVFEPFRKESQYSLVRVVAERRLPQYRVLILDRLWHSGANIANPLKPISEYAWVFEGVIDAVSGTGHPLSALVIGGGGYVMPQYLALTRPGSEIHVAEIDPVVTEAAYAAFGLRSNTALRIHHGDARNVVADLARARPAPVFDCVMGNSMNNLCLPYQLTTREFNDAVAGLLATNGVYMVHLVDDLERGQFLGAMLHTMRLTWPHLYTFSFTSNLVGAANCIVVGSRQARDFTALPEEIRRRYPNFGGVLLDEARLAAAEERAGGRVLTDDCAPVENLMEQVICEHTTDAVEEYYRRAGRAAGRGDFARALAWADRAVARQPAGKEALFQRALVYRQQGDTAAALRDLDAATRVDAFFLKARQARAELLAERGDWAAAGTELDRILAFMPDNSAAHNLWGLMLAAQGDEARAMGRWRQVLAHDPANATAHYYLARCLLRQGAWSEGAWHARQAEQADPGLASIQRLVLPAAATNAGGFVRQLLF